MADFTSVDANLKWAKKHIRDLEAYLRTFFGTKPYVIVVKPHPKDAERSQLVLDEIRRDIPPYIPLGIGDVVHALRSALDQLAYAATPTKDAAFPIWRQPRIPTTKEYESLVDGKVKGAAPAFVSALKGLQPYEGGNDEALWALDYLDITDKHRLLITAAAASRGVNLDFGSGFGMPLLPRVTLMATVPGRPSEPLKPGHVFFEGTQEDMNKFKPAAPIEIAFGEPRCVWGEPVMPALANLMKTVTDIIEQFRRLI